jgi:hypothetical protein
MLFKMGEALRMAFLRDGKVGRGETDDGFAGFIGDDDVEQDFAGGVGDRGGWRVGAGESLRGVLRRGLSCDAEREGGNGQAAKQGRLAASKFE